MACDARRLGFQVGGIVALVGEQLAAVDFADPFGHVIQEVTVVGYRKHGTLVGLEELLQPQHGFGIQVVGGLVQKQQVGSFQKQAAQRDATALATGKHAHGGIGIGALQRVHGLGKLAVQIPAVRGVDVFLQAAHFVHQHIEVGVGIGHFLADLIEALDLRIDVAKGHLDVFQDGLVFLQRGLLLQDAHGVAGGQARIARGNLFQTGHDLQQGGLAHAVGADDADLRPRVEAQGHVVQDNLIAMRLAGAVHLVDEFCHANRIPFRCSDSLKSTGPP